MGVATVCISTWVAASIITDVKTHKNRNQLLGQPANQPTNQPTIPTNQPTSQPTNQPTTTHPATTAQGEGECFLPTETAKKPYPPTPSAHFSKVSCFTVVFFRQSATVNLDEKCKIGIQNAIILQRCARSQSPPQFIIAIYLLFCMVENHTFYR